ncbi:MAG TPA: hypothetical protein VLK36_07955 [Gaiellaceae bacterium]|nr:hypothetical protein [Gaiellaceae bacterium]
MADIPEGIVLERNRDLEGPGFGIRWRRVVIGLVTLFVLLGLLNVFGQRPSTTHAATSTASLELYAPARLRSGLLYEARFTIRAFRDLDHARLSLSPGWSEGMQMNTIEPGPVDETSDNGRLVLSLGKIPAGHLYRLFMQFQTNPTNVGRRSATVVLLDGTTPLIAINRTVTIFP